MVASSASPTLCPSEALCARPKAVTTPRGSTTSPTLKSYTYSVLETLRTNADDRGDQRGVQHLVDLCANGEARWPRPAPPARRSDGWR